MINLKLWKERKKVLHWNYERIAKEAGVSKRTIEDIFRGYTPTPRIDTVQAIEKALGLDGGITPEEYEAGVRYTKKVSITADEECVLDKAREVMDELGEKGKRLIIDFCDALLEKVRKN